MFEHCEQYRSGHSASAPDCVYPGSVRRSGLYFDVFRLRVLKHFATKRVEECKRDAGGCRNIVHQSRNLIDGSRSEGITLPRAFNPSLQHCCLGAVVLSVVTCPPPRSAMFRNAEKPQRNANCSTVSSYGWRVFGCARAILAQTLHQGYPGIATPEQPASVVGMWFSVCKATISDRKSTVTMRPFLFPLALLPGLLACKVLHKYCGWLWYASWSNRCWNEREHLCVCEALCKADQPQPSSNAL